MDSHEEWRTIREANGVYSVSNKGRVKNNRTGYILKTISFTRGYMKVNLKVEGKSISRLVHRLVATEFIPNPEGKPEVNHKNGIHDDNRLSNLEWVTSEENNRHAYETGLVKHKDDRYSGYLYSLWRKRHHNGMCNEWKDYLAFYEWCISQGYVDGLYINRYETDKIYSPENCYVGNSCQRHSEYYICFGEKLTVNQLSSKYNVGENTLRYRLNMGMTVEDAVMLEKGRAKDNKIRLRLSDRLYDYIFDKSKRLNISASEYIRRLIDRDMMSNGSNHNNPDRVYTERGRDDSGRH